jgi:proline dehydrogenase
LFGKLYKEFPVNVGIVIQAYLKRSLADLEHLKSISIEAHPVNIRLCKGIYIEPVKIAYKRRNEIRENFVKCFQKLLDYNFYPALATHDKKLIDELLTLIKKHKLDRDSYEFQMLLGVTPHLRRQLVEENHQMRVYVPYGEDWFNYSIRRLQENPRMVQDIIKSLFLKG